MTATTETPESSPNRAPITVRRSQPRRLRSRYRYLLVVPAALHESSPFPNTARLQEAFTSDLRLLATHAEVSATIGVAPETVPQASDSICILSTDTPHLPPAFLAEAFARLEHSPIDSVCVPADNGDYCLVGFKRALFEQLQETLGTRPDTLQIAWETAHNLGARKATLPAWYRIQTDDDLQKLRRDITRGTVNVPGTAAVLGL